ncbi:hypothetical protein TNCT_665281 [Trichonephila clavata]|uniref:Uncharacterized protein n=1 Tax=Trichonephila clavata TaxID=2740835 RepID=A0A8X6IY28_TRICU|nr:hypothetical protein TNCT_665281 [Trichonephila clavata]
MFLSLLRTVFLVEYVLLGKVLYMKTKGNASAAFRELRRKKNLRRGSMSTKGIPAVIKGFEVTKKLGDQHGKDRKRIIYRYLLMPSGQLLTHRHHSLGAVAHVRFLDRYDILTAPYS